ncbi:MAG: tetratricopeptide repeat protein [Methanosarcinaceae archaeon]
MKRETCIICSIARGRRVCLINDNSLICPVCCAKTRTPDCKDCIHYVQAEKHKKGKLIEEESKPVLIEIDPEIEEKVDQALDMAEKGNIQGAESLLMGLLSEHSHIDMVQYGIGVICTMKNQFEKAILYFDKAIKLNPYFVEAWFNKGAAHQKRLEISPMIKAYRVVIELGDDSEHFVAQAKSMVKGFENEIRTSSDLSMDEYLKSMDIFNAAFAAMEKMEWEKAISGYKKVLSMNPRHTQSYGNLGICYGNLGEKQEALANLDKALELDPDYEPAIINREVVSCLADGEELPLTKFKSVDYYKNFPVKKKSLIRKIFG